MKLSIIVPVYNAEAFLRPCLDSLINQTIGDYEIILINDGSTDGSLAILDEYQQRFPDKIRVETVANGGQGRARNIGLRMARGDYLGFVDSDDWIDPHMYEKLLSAAEEAGADLAQCDRFDCWPDGRCVYKDMTGYQGKMAIDTAVWNKLIKRSAAEGITFFEGLWYEDMAYVVGLVLRTEQIVNVREGLYFYRCGHTSTMNNNNARKNLDMIQVLERLKGPMLEAGKQDSFEELIINHLLLDTIKRVAAQDGPDREPVLRELRVYVRRSIPHLLRCESFRRESRNRQIVMFLNYHGLERLGLLLLRIKEKLG